jgi:hypothetical protein
LVESDIKILEKAEEILDQDLKNLKNNENQENNEKE